jgi:hypothetical protein
MTVRAHLQLGAVVAAGLLLVACGSDDSGTTASPAGRDSPVTTTEPSSAASGDAPDACSLLTADVVAAALAAHNPASTGYAVQLVDDPAGENDCTVRWTSGGGGDEFTLSLFDADGYVADPSGPGPRPIAGIGDRAFEVDGSFYAQVGDQMVHLVNVQEGEGTDEDILAVAARRLASESG